MRAIIGTALGTAAAAVVGSLASRSSIDTWYRGLDKPPYVPPNVVFPVAWTSLYADIAVTSGQTLDRLKSRGDDTRSYTTALATNLVLNAGWSWLFFKAHKFGTIDRRRRRTGGQQRRPRTPDGRRPSGRRRRLASLSAVVHVRHRDDG